jgi:pimeloyl-ACP methyl ester carboxylesterase
MKGRMSILRHGTIAACPSPVWWFGLCRMSMIIVGATGISAKRPAAPDPVFADVADKPSLPRVLLIGDSISMGYTIPVRRLLDGKASVHRIPENGGPTTNGIANVDSWVGKGSWDVIHFNFGLHDLKIMGDGSNQVPVQQYEQNLDRLVTRLSQKGADLIWATTTPVPEGRLAVPRRTADVLVYNAAAERVMMHHQLAIDDLYGFAKPIVSEIQEPLNVHFSDQGYQRLAETVAASIMRVLEIRNLPAPKRRPQNAFFVTRGNVYLHYIESGRGPAILFVPGSSMSAEIWADQIRYFSARYHVVALDPRSQGHSSQTTEGNNPEQRSRDIKEIIEELHLAPVVLVAWSMSVRDTLAYVSQFGTSALRGMVLVDGRIRRLDSKQLEEIWNDLKEMENDRSSFTARFVRSMYKTPQPEAYLKRITDLSLRTPTNTVFSLSTSALLSDWTPALDRIDKPLLYVISSPVLNADADLLRRRVRSSRVEVFEGVGHALFVDESARFNSLLDEFLANLT